MAKKMNPIHIRGNFTVSNVELDVTVTLKTSLLEIFQSV